MSAKLLGRTGATAGRDFPLKDLVRLGASPENEIRIPAPGVSRRHARIWRENDQFFIEDVGATNGTFLNGGRIQREPLRHLDIITLGREVDLIFVNRPSEAAEAAPPTVYPDQIRRVALQFTDGPDAATTIEVPKGEITFGRSETCNVVLTSRAIGKLHARMQRTGNQVVLQDLQSVNGTFVNGARVDVTVLANGDTINFAGVRSLTIAIEGTEAAVAGTTGAPLPQAMALPVFDQEWKTRFMWSPDELAAIEAARKDAQALADLRASADQKPAAAAKAPPPKPAAAAPAKAAAVPAPDKQAPAPAPPDKPVAAAAKPPVPKPAAAAPPPPPVSAPRPPEPPKVEKGPEPPKAVPVDEPIDVTTPTAIFPAPAAASAASPVPPPVPPKPPEAAKAGKPPEAPNAGKPPETPKADVRPAPRIRSVTLVGGGTRATIGIGSATIGRSATADVRIDDRQVSRQHARITVTESAVTIEDLQTVNGTVVNGREVKGPETLRDGDTILFGASEFKVEVLLS